MPETYDQIHEMKQSVDPESALIIDDTPAVQMFDELSISVGNKIDDCLNNEKIIWNDEKYREEFKKFMIFLDEQGKSSWTLEDLKAWSPKFYNRLYNAFKQKNKWSYITEKFIDPEQLEKHPCKLGYPEWSDEKYKEEFKKFVAHLDEKEQSDWGPEDLNEWSPKFYERLRYKFKGKDRWEMIVKTFMEPVDLIRHPLNLREKWTDSKIKKTFSLFFKDLHTKKIHVWNLILLRRWRFGGKPLGNNLIQALLRKNQNILIGLITYIEVQFLKKFKFTHRDGKTLPEAPLSNDSTVHHRRINTSDAAYLPENSTNLEQNLADNDLARKLYKAIEELPPDQKALAEAVLAGDETADIQSVIAALRQKILSPNELADLEMSQVAAE